MTTTDVNTRYDALLAFAVDVLGARYSACTTRHDAVLGEVVTAHLPSGQGVFIWREDADLGPNDFTVQPFDS